MLVLLFIALNYSRASALTLQKSIDKLKIRPIVTHENVSLKVKTNKLSLESCCPASNFSSDQSVLYVIRSIVSFQLVIGSLPSTYTFQSMQRVNTN